MTRWALVIIPFLLVACGEEESSGGAVGNRPKQNVSQPPPPKKSETPDNASNTKDEAFVYRSDGVRDPFQPFIVTISDDDPKDVCALCVPLANLTFTGVVTGIASPVALVETREGAGYFVRRGSELGANGGRVIDIREGVILLRERFQDQLGRISVVDRSLRIRPEDPMAANASDEDLVETSDPRPANDNTAPTEEERVKKTSGPADEL